MFNLTIFLSIIIFYLLTYLFFNFRIALNLLFITELVWIMLYLLLLVYGYLYNDINLLALTFFILIFSAFEFGFGLLLLNSWLRVAGTLSLNKTLY